MTDRELLELAAKAAGIDGWWEQSYLSFIKRSGGPWDPLCNDGDALRLLAERGLNVSWEYKADHVLVEDVASDVYVCEPIVAGDRARALRRAITACMAEIGRTM